MCGCSEEENKKRGVRFALAKDRSCTDILILLLFLAAGAVAIWMIVRASQNGGDPYRVAYGVDYKGNICGRSPGYEDKIYAAWPILPIVTNDVDHTRAEEFFRIKVCIESCSETNLTNSQQFKSPYVSEAVWRYCIPTTVTENTESIVSPAFNTASETASRTMMDLYQTWPVLAVVAGGAALLGLIYAKCMSFKCCRVMVVWITILLILGCSAYTAYLFLSWSKTVVVTPVDMFDRRLAAKVIGWIIVGLTVVFLLLVLALRKRINFAIAVIGATASATSQMKSIYLYPIIPMVFIVGFLIYWIIGAMYLFSVKDIYEIALPSDYSSIPEFAALPPAEFTYEGYNWNTSYQYYFIYHLFHLFWVTKSIQYLAYMTLAGAIGQWFFADPSDTTGRVKVTGRGPTEFPHFPIANMMVRVIRFHMGTAMFGALIIAIIQTIRAVLTYIQHKTRNKNNMAVRCLLCCVNCCLKCCQKCIDYVSRNALVLTAVNGTNFCSSACTAFGLLTSNILRTFAMNLVTGFILFLGKLIISALATIGAGIYIKLYYVDKNSELLFSPVVPVVGSFVVSYIIASLFMYIFGVAAETMFILFLSDTEGRHTPAGIKASFKQMTEDAERQDREEKEIDEIRKRQKMEYKAAKKARKNGTGSSYTTTTTSNPSAAGQSTFGKY